MTITGMTKALAPGHGTRAPDSRGTTHFLNETASGDSFSSSKRSNGRTRPAPTRVSAFRPAAPGRHSAVADAGTSTSSPARWFRLLSAYSSPSQHFGKTIQRAA